MLLTYYQAMPPQNKGSRAKIFKFKPAILENIFPQNFQFIVLYAARQVCKNQKAYFEIQLKTSPGADCWVMMYNEVMLVVLMNIEAMSVCCVKFLRCEKNFSLMPATSISKNRHGFTSLLVWQLLVTW